jgi:drug/metabolite transporter (DMT)-like permease
MHPLKRFSLLIVLVILWSQSFLFIKLALIDFSPVSIAFIRVFMASAIFMLALTFSRLTLPKDKKFWMHSSFMALFSSCIPFFLFCYAETSIDSSLAALLNGSTPMFTALLAHQFLPSDKLNVNKTVGIVFSFFGLIMLFAPNLMGSIDVSFWGMVWVIVGSFSYAICHVYAKKYTAGHAVLVAPTAQMLLSALFLSPFAFFHMEVGQLYHIPSLQAVAGLTVLAFFGTFVSFIIYYKLIEHSGPTAISMVSCFFPVVGMFTGFFFLKETLTTTDLISSLLILVGLLLVNEVFVWKKRPVMTT